MDKILQRGTGSENPLQDRVIPWTRLNVPRHNPVDVSWHLARVLKRSEKENLLLPGISN